MHIHDCRQISSFSDEELTKLNVITLSITFTLLFDQKKYPVELSLLAKHQVEATFFVCEEKP